MTKPDWLVENEKKKRQPKLKMCKDCTHFGEVVKFNKVKIGGKIEKLAIRECDIHSGCMNSRLSYACKDWIRQVP